MRLRPTRLFWRIYFYGAGLLVTVAVAIGVVAYVDAEHGQMRDVVDRVVHLTEKHAQDPQRLQLWLDDLSTLLGGGATILAADGAEVAQAGLSVKDPFTIIDTIRSRDIVHQWGQHRHIARLSDGRILVVQHTKHGPSHLVGFGLLLVILALVSWPFARGIARPLERLTRVAKQLGKGDLSARAALKVPGEIGQLSDSIDEMANNLEGKIRSQRDLLIAVSHELRTPLSRVRVALELLEGADNKSELRLIEGDLDELDILIGDLLTAARLDQGGFVLRRAQVDLTQMLARCSARFQPLHPTAKLKINCPLDLHLNADPGLIRRVVDNLLDNAANYGNGAVWLDVARTDTHLQVTVRDDGTSLNPAQVGRLFEPFFRTDQSRQRATGGVGLGLTLCRRIAEAHSGRVEAMLNQSGGLQVILTLPT